MNKTFKMLVDNQYQAEKLLTMMDKIGCPATYKKTPNGKYLITYIIEL
jgi:hypothetical protein